MIVEIIDPNTFSGFNHLNPNDYPIFFTPNYHRFEQNSGFKTGFIHHDNKIFMPFRIYHKWVFNFMQIMYPPMCKGERLGHEEERVFLNKAVEVLKSEKKYHRIIQPYVWDVFYAYPDNAVSCPFGQLYSELDNKTMEEIFNEFSPKYRNAIRKVSSFQNAVSVRHNTQELQAFYEVYKDVHARQNVYYDTIQHFERMQQYLGKDNFLLTNLYFNDILEGGAIVSYTSKEANYLYGGAKNPTQQNGSIKLLQYEIIKFLKNKQVKKYIWGGCRLSDVTGTKQQGMQEFKLRFGAKVKKGYLWKLDINSTYCLIYDWMIATQQRLKGQKPVVDVIDYEKNREVIL